jgi:hypothetical protein
MEAGGGGAVSPVILRRVVVESESRSLSRDVDDFGASGEEEDEEDEEAEGTRMALIRFSSFRVHDWLVVTLHK